jgi:subtilisin family serine protease
VGVLNQLKTMAGARVIVTLHDPVTAYLDAQRQRNGSREKGLKEEISDELHKKLIADAQATVLGQLSNHRRAEPNFELKRQYDYIPALAGTVTAAALTVLQNHPQVASIRLDEQRKFTVADSLPIMQANTVHALSYTGKGVTVAVLDTGVDATHPDLAGSIIAQHCFSEASCPPFGLNESDSAEDDIYGRGHGTHIAGIITSPYGVAPDANIVAVKVSSNIIIFNVPLDSDILAGLDWIRTNLNTLPVQIINLSIGDGSFTNVCDDEHPEYSNIFKQLVAQGVTIFVATGNDGSSGIGSPACLNDAIAVGATNVVDEVAGFSNSNNLVDILAPGEDITSSLIGGGTITKGGTSFAAPMAAGVAALMLEANPKLTPSLIELLLENTGVTLMDTKNNLTFPRINALAAVEGAQREQSDIFDFVAKGYKVDEFAKTVMVEVSRFGSGNGRVSIDYATVDGTAQAGNDYIAANGTLIWEHGDTGNKNFIITIADDSIMEDFEEAFSVSLHNPIGNFVGAMTTRHQALVTILDDEAVGSIEITGIGEETRIDDFFVFDIDYGVNEESGSITIEVARKDAGKGTVSVDYFSLNGTAEEGIDYTDTEGTLTWGDGDMDDKSFTVNILDDTIFEGKETFLVFLSNPTFGATLGGDFFTTIVIADNEYGIGITDSSFESGDAGSLFGLSPHPVWNVGISLSESPIWNNHELARTGNNFLNFGGIPLPTATFAIQSFIIPSNTKELIFWLKIPETGDTENDFFGVMLDNDEHFIITAQDADYTNNYKMVSIDVSAYADNNLHNLFFYAEVLGSDTTFTRFLVDDVELLGENSSFFQFSQPNYSVNENSGLVTFKVTRLLQNQGKVSVDYMTSDKTAQAKVDYVSTGGTLTWQDGDSSEQSFTVAIIDDNFFGDNKTFKVSLFNPTGGASTMLTKPAIVTIIDDEIPAEGISDGSFELGMPNPVWNEFDDFGISPICTHSTCGTLDFPSQAYIGEYFAWFGSASLPRIGSLEQTLLIPVGTTTLSFWLQIPSAEDSGYLQVSIDNNSLFRVSQTDVVNYSNYNLVTLDISGYADGKSHKLRFYSKVEGGGATRFFADHVGLSSPSSTCIPTVTPKPTAPSLEVTINGNDAGATWTTVTGAQGYNFSYAPYSDPISAVTRNQIKAWDLGAQTQIARNLSSGSAFYIAVQAYNCSGKSPYSDLKTVIIP